MLKKNQQPSKMAKAKAVIKNQNGIHCRPSAVIIGHSKEYSGSIKLTSGQGETDLRSVLGLVGLGLEHGKEVELEVEGDDAESFCQSLVELFETEFDYPDKEA